MPADRLRTARPGGRSSPRRMSRKPPPACTTSPRTAASHPCSARHKALRPVRPTSIPRMRPSASGARSHPCAASKAPRSGTALRTAAAPRTNPPAATSRPAASVRDGRRQGLRSDRRFSCQVFPRARREGRKSTVKRHSHRTFLHLEFLRRLGDRQAIDRDRLQHIALALRQRLQMRLDVHAIRHLRRFLAGKHLGEIVDVHEHPAAAATQRVDQLVARNGEQPRRERRFRVPGVSLQMHREQGILHNILGLIGRLPGTRQAAPRRRPQDRRDGRQETMVGGGVTRIGRPHQVGPFMFLAAHRAPSDGTGCFLGCYGGGWQIIRFPGGARSRRHPLLNQRFPAFAAMWPPPAGHSAGGRWIMQDNREKNGDEIMSRGIRYALIVTAMAFAWVAGTPAPSQAAPQGDAAATSAKPLALGKFSKHRKKRVRHHARSSRKHHHHQASAKTSSSKADKNDDAQAATETKADESLPPSVANARAELTSGNQEHPLAAAAAAADSSTLTEADKAATTGTATNGVEVTTSDQLNEMDRDAATQAATTAPPPASTTVALAQISQPAAVSSGDDSAWGSASLIGKIFIAFGVMLTLASAARMVIALARRATTSDRRARASSRAHRAPCARDSRRLLIRLPTYRALPATAAPSDSRPPAAISAAP